MSLNSPGVSVWWPDQHKLKVVVWAQRNRDVSKGHTFRVKVQSLPDPWTSLHTVELKVLPRLKPNLNRIARMDAVVQQVMDCVPESTDVVGVEHYAYSCVSSSVSGLCELGGILRHALWKRNLVVEEIAPNHAKSIFAQSGRATKFDMLQAFRSFGFPDVMTHFGLSFGKDKFGEYKKVPTPIEDLVDSVALAYTVWHDRLHPTKPKKKKKSRKRKRDNEEDEEYEKDEEYEDSKSRKRKRTNEGGSQRKKRKQ